MNSKNEIGNINGLNSFIKIFFFASLFFNNLLFQLKNDNNLTKNLNCYFFGDIYNLRIPKTHICSNIDFLNTSFYYYDKILINNIDLLIINSQKSKIYDIFLLIGIMPFLNEDSLIYYKINNKDSYKLFKNKLKFIKISNRLASINKKSYNYFIKHFEDIISYRWEIKPNKNIINNIRYIINNYYAEPYIDIFDNSLNYNFKYYIENSFSNFTFDDLNNLMSKYLYL